VVDVVGSWAGAARITGSWTKVVDVVGSWAGVARNSTGDWTKVNRKDS